MSLQVWVEAEEHISPAEVREQVQGQLKALKTDYLDLCLLPALSDGAAFQVRNHAAAPKLSCRCMHILLCFCRMQDLVAILSSAILLMVAGSQSASASWAFAVPPSHVCSWSLVSMCPLVWRCAGGVARAGGPGGGWQRAQHRAAGREHRGAERHHGLRPRAARGELAGGAPGPPQRRAARLLPLAGARFLAASAYTVPALFNVFPSPCSLAHRMRMHAACSLGKVMMCRYMPSVV